MKIVFHEKYYTSNYSMDPAAASGRLDSIMTIIKTKKDEYEIINPNPATEVDIVRAHSERHYNAIKNDSLLFEMSSLAAGGAILAAEESYDGNPTFAVIRPPGHHASADSCWGFCFFNNISVSLLRLYSEKKIKSAFVLDFDLHTGDGNLNILTNRNDNFRVKILNPRDESSSSNYIAEVETYMQNLEDIDIFVASAGFDQGINDWGRLLHADDYKRLGSLMKEYSEKLCKGRRYALFEGGYYHPDLGPHVHSFCQGFR